MPLQTGQVLNNRYRIVKLLGQGGFGAVYRSWDSNLNRPCAVKENLDISPEAQRQFTREATVLANLSHPNLPRVTDHFILPGQGQYLVMDFVEGDDLASILRQRGPIPVQQAVVWISQVADALAYLHSRKPPVVHRDIKPANIRITPEGTAMLVDFGLVKVYNPQLRTTLGARAVTPGYAPPEQYGQGSTDARSDIYALGATMYNILTGQEPMESVQRMSGAQMRALTQLNPGVPIGISQSIEKSMRLEPTQRFQSVGDFKSSLSVIKEPILARPVQPTHVVPAPRPPSAEPKIRASDSKPTTKKNSRVMVGVGALIVVCVIGGIGLLGWIVSAQNESAQATADAQLQATLAERVRTTSTAQAIVTGTARAEATQQAASLQLQDNAKLVFGPSSDFLEHTEGESIVAQDAEINLRDFIVEARFFNPYSAADGEWDYGFILRHETKNVQYRFAVRSEKTWVLINNIGEPNGETIAEGELPDLKTGDGEWNLIKLIFQGNRGWFYLNDQLITDLNLSARMNSGGIYIATGIFKAGKTPGKATPYEDFRIFSIQ